MDLYESTTTDDFHILSRDTRWHVESVLQASIQRLEDEPSGICLLKVLPTSEANFDSVKHFIYHLALQDMASFVPANGCISSKNSSFT